VRPRGRLCCQTGSGTPGRLGVEAVSVVEDRYTVPQPAARAMRWTNDLRVPFEPASRMCRPGVRPRREPYRTITLRHWTIVTLRHWTIVTVTLKSAPASLTSTSTYARPAGTGSSLEAIAADYPTASNASLIRPPRRRRLRLPRPPAGPCRHRDGLGTASARQLWCWPAHAISAKTTAAPHAITIATICSRLSMPRVSPGRPNAP
jgi:hypothetical protein